MSRLTRDGTPEPVSRDQIFRHARGQGNIHFPGSADHEQEWQPYPVDPYSAICDDHTYIHKYSDQGKLETSQFPELSIDYGIAPVPILRDWKSTASDKIVADFVNFVHIRVRRGNSFEDGNETVKEGNAMIR